MNCYLRAFVIVLGLLGLSGPISGQDRDRREFDQLLKRGLWQEAVILGERILENHNDRESAADFTKTIQGLSRLRIWDQFDELLERTAATKANNGPLLVAAANSFREAPSEGLMVAGGFIRGNVRGRGDRVDLSERDRVRRLQLYRQALDLTPVEDAAQQGEIWQKIGDALISGRRRASDAWRLQLLTHLARLPDPTDGDESSASGAPVDAKGNPVRHAIPASWNAAKTDGERWRFARAEQVRLNPATASNEALERGGLMETWFGTGTLNSSGWWGTLDLDRQKGMLEVHTLTDEESLAKLADGVKRFKLPTDHHFIALYQRAYEISVSQRLKDPVGAEAGQKLVEVYLSRRQYTNAAAWQQRVIADYGQGENRFRTKRLNQIVGNWGKFESTEAFPAGSPPKLPIIFRNAPSVTLEARPIDLPRLMADTRAWLKGNPTEIDRLRLNPGNVGQRLMERNPGAFLGRPVARWAVNLQPKAGHWDTSAEIEVPWDQPGAYLVTAKLPGGNEFSTVLWIQAAALLHRPTKDGQLWWAVDAVTGEPLADAEVRFFGYESSWQERRFLRDRYEVRTKEFVARTDANGRLLLRKEDSDDKLQWLTVLDAGPRGLAFHGFESFRFPAYSWETTGIGHGIGITDRPAYRPGQTVHLKFWFREAGYAMKGASVFSGKVCDLKIIDPEGAEVETIKGLRVDEWGGVEATLELERDAKLGRWRAVMAQEKFPEAEVRFRVEEYKKPEFEVVIEGPPEQVVLGDRFRATVRATYYHGAPVTRGTAKVTVWRDTFDEPWFPEGRWDWLYGIGYWWPGVAREWYPGWNGWGRNPPERSGSGWNLRESGEVVLQREFPIGPDGTVEVEVDTSLAKLAQGDSDHRYQIEAEVVDSSRRLISGSGMVVVAREPLRATVWLDRGYARAGQAVTASFVSRSLDGKPVPTKGKARLFKVSYDQNRQPVEKRVSEWDVATDEHGEGTLKFQVAAVGQYRFSVTLANEAGRQAEGATVFSARGPGGGGASRSNPIEVVADKLEYQPGETAKLLIETERPDSLVWVFLRHDNSVAGETRMIRTKGRTAELDLRLTPADMPNVFVEVVTISGARVHSAVRQIVLPPESRLLTVDVEPLSDRLQPREATAVKVQLRDADGKPFVGTTVVTVYDKALEAISGGSNVMPIHQAFWSWQRSYNAYAVRSSLNLRSGNLMRENAPSMSSLRTLNHITAESEARPKFWGRPATYMPAPAYMSNGGGPEDDVTPGLLVRSEFADLVKWVSRLETDANGEAEIPLEMPDDLTTWVVKVWAMGDGTRVGEGSAEIITSKELIVRLQAPRFFVEKDEVVLSAVVHNDHDEAKEVTVSLELDGGNLTVDGPAESVVEVAAKGEARVDWRAKVLREGEVTVRMKAVTDDDGDAMEKRFPVYVHGMLRTDAWSRTIDPKGNLALIEIEIPEDRRPEQTKLEVRYSPSAAAAMVDALPYLAEFPYGCTEQTMNRFVSTVAVQRLLGELGIDLEEIRLKRANLNPQERGDAAERAAGWRTSDANPVFDRKTVAAMVAKGVADLQDMQNNDGGWGWFSGWDEASYPHTTAVVVHGLLKAKADGANIPERVVERGLGWLESHEEWEAKRIRQHGGRQRNTKKQADSLDALIRCVLGDGGRDHPEMLGFLFRDRVQLPVYAKALLGLELHRVEALGQRDEVIRGIEQFLKFDPENQTAFLDLRNGSYWWRWDGSEFEAHAWYLKLLAAAKPHGREARGLVKYLLNNRKHATHWNSTRDTAYCIEAIGDYLKATGELMPEMEISIAVDGREMKRAKVTRENLFTDDPTLTLEGDALGSGKHMIEVRKTGTGTVYANAYLEVFSLEEKLRAAGLEVKVQRRYWKLDRALQDRAAADSGGAVISQQVTKLLRTPLEPGDVLASGDRVEVELLIESKNDYEYLMFEDWKPAGLEAVQVRSGDNPNGLGAYMQLRDEKVTLFVRHLPRGSHQLRYELRAEIPGIFHALPTRAEAMYAPELRANSESHVIEVSGE